MALTLVSCGSAKQSAESGDEAQIREVLTEAMTTNDPAQCTTIATGGFLEQNFEERGLEAIDECRFEARLSKTTFAEELEFSDVSINGAKAEATVEASGGSEDGTIVRIELVRDADQWKLDRFSDFEIDRPRFDRALYETSVAEGATPGEARCVVADTRRRWTTAQLERDAVRTDFRDVPDPTVLCLGRATLQHLFEEGFREGAADEKLGLPPPVLDCIVNRFTERLSVAQMQTLLSAGDALDATLGGLTLSAAKACSREYRAGVLGERPPT